MKLYKITYIRRFFKPNKATEVIEVKDIDYVWAKTRDNAEYKFIMSEQAWGMIEIVSIREMKGHN